MKFIVYFKRIILTKNYWKCIQQNYKRWIYNVNYMIYINEIMEKYFIYGYIFIYNPI